MGAAKTDEARRRVRTSAIAPPCVPLEGGATIICATPERRAFFERATQPCRSAKCRHCYDSTKAEFWYWGLRTKGFLPRTSKPHTPLCYWGFRSFEVLCRTAENSQPARGTFVLARKSGIFREEFSAMLPRGAPRALQITIQHLFFKPVPAQACLPAPLL